jgi:hypothetical protein
VAEQRVTGVPVSEQPASRKDIGQAMNMLAQIGIVEIGALLPAVDDARQRQMTKASVRATMARLALASTSRPRNGRSSC